MTLILTVNGRESIWMLADRRLSYSPPKPPKEDARKFMFLDTPDAVAMIGYAGLGATALGTEPADWISAVLRGRSFPLEQTIEGLAAVVQREFPTHVAQLSKDIAAAHYFVIPAFLNGEIRLYIIDLVFAPDRKSYTFSCTRRMGKQPNRTPRFAVAGSGQTCLERDRNWIKGLIRLVRASDSAKVSPHVVADYLAKINQIAHLKTLDGSVGPRCIVAWRHNRVGAHKGGGGHQFYDGTQRTADSGAIPVIANGLDVQAYAQTIMRVTGPHMAAQLEALKSGTAPVPFDEAKLNEELAKLPEKSDENLK